MISDLKSLESRLAAAQRMADAASAIILPLFKNSSLKVEYKEAVSPIVTQADKESEEAMRRIIESEFPRDTIVGEEHGSKEGDSGFSWILDPVDGTIAFSLGKPVFGTLIGLAHEDRFQFGILEQAVLKERFVGVSGSAATLNNEPLSSSSKVDLERASLALTSPQDHEGVDHLVKAVHVTSYGGDCYNYALLASGHIDIVLEKGLALHDYAALVPLVEASGGVITDWQGRDVKMDREPGGTSNILACGNKALHDKVLKFIDQ